VTKKQQLQKHYVCLFENDKLTQAEKVGHIYAASHIDPCIEELTIEEARILVAEIMAEGRE
jgi:hypothetical protein